MTSGERIAIQPVPCERHHNVLTLLRCGRCGTPICPKCLIHTDVGARCPKCARPARNRALEVEFVGYILAAGAGIMIGVASGFLLTFLRLGMLSIIGLLLMGFLVGESVSAAANHKRGPALAIIAFCAACLGPVLGSTIAVLGIEPRYIEGGRVGIALVAALASQGPLGLLVLLIAGAIAASRVQRF